MSEQPRRTKFDVKREATRADLLELGAARFPIAGYVATSVDDVVRGTGHTKGAVYFHFGSKEGYFLEVMRFRGSLMESWWGNFAGRSFASINEGLEAATGWLGVGEGLPDTAMLSEFRFAMRDKPEMLEALTELYGQWIDNLAVFVTILTEQGLVRTDRSVRELAESMYHVTDGYVLHGAVFGSSLALLRNDLIRVLQP
ncbi:TetR/AcrR family transcriptional regulator [Demequina zhanjiangensis]|uniref:TetR/AcrR family transcriptional regulator n=1 Tax=Demequina zhanjiangensis TaxID=3051659 RepID=A0ABT8FXW4_9MICO|nr:TetR/AcrR family transcriptional regulator [Demequina sp. SYSU T00b26]MDN4471741.1 TetR/AcrR family transcriptional regulator [Demequina sp. SYSU T00b26]